MATTSIGAAKTHTDIDAWEIATDNDLVTATEGEIGEIQTDEDFGNKNVAFAGATTNSSFFRKLTVASANRNAGVAGTDHARVYTDGSGHALEFNEDFFFLEFLDIEMGTSGGDSDEGIRVQAAADNCLISRCLIHSADTTDNQDGIYMPPGAMTLSVDHCILYGWRRAGIHPQNFSGSATMNINVDFCTLANNGAQGDSVTSGGVAITENSGAITNAAIFNVASLDNSPSSALDYNESTNPPAWSGTDNIASDTSAESKFTDSFDSVALVTSAPGSGENFHVNNKTSGSENLLIAGENSFTKSQEGLDRTGSEPDSRQDFSTDIVGRSRVSQGSVTIGAYQFEQAALSIPVAMDSYKRRR